MQTFEGSVFERHDLPSRVSSFGFLRDKPLHIERHALHYGGSSLNKLSIERYSIEG